MTKLRVLDLFSGIGGFSLGLERTGGFETVAFCEIEEYPRRVLAKHWPKVPIYDDVRTLTADTLRRDGIAVDVICGGFPCQDISTAGKGAGLAGERSGLWREYARLIGELRPGFVIVENVAALLGRGLADVLGDLASIRYDAEWHCIPASTVGAPHRRDRIWIVAYPNHTGPQRRDGTSVRECAGEWTARPSSPFTGLANASGKRRSEARKNRERPTQWTTRSGDVLANAHAGDEQRRSRNVQVGGAGSRAKLSQMVTPEELNGTLNPTWVEWLMGFPLGWTALEDSATPSSPRSPNSSAKRSSKQKG